MTRFKLDENMPAAAATVLSEAGHDVATALQEGLGGTPDETVLAACGAEGRVLVTLDLDFADTRSYGSAGCPGIIVLRLPRQDVARIRAVMLRALPELQVETPVEGIWILEPHRRAFGAPATRVCSRRFSLRQLWLDEAAPAGGAQEAPSSCTLLHEQARQARIWWRPLVQESDPPQQQPGIRH